MKILGERDWFKDIVQLLVEKKIYSTLLFSEYKNDRVQYE